MDYLPFDTYQECMEVLDGAQQQMKDITQDGPVNSGMYCLGVNVTGN